MQNRTQTIILAGGKGTRMKTEHPKCLTLLGGKTFLDRVMEASSSVCDKPIIVLGYKGEEVVESLGTKIDTKDVEIVWQHEQLGTGHAVSVAKDAALESEHKNVLVLMGDQPLISRASIEELVNIHNDRGAAVTVMTAVIPSFENEFSPFVRYGRIIRDEHNFVDKIVEYKDATDEERDIKEVNIGMYMFDAGFLWEAIENLSDDNASGEYYITELIQIAFDQGKKVVPFVLPDTTEAFGVNSLEDLEIAKSKLDSAIL